MTELEEPKSSPLASSASSAYDHTTSPNDPIATEKATTFDPSQGFPTVRPIHGWKWVAACFCIYLSAFLYGLDTTIAADVQPAIVKSLGEIEKLTWIGAGFPLGSVAIILPLGYAYGLFELKKLFLAFVILFEAGSALCGAAPTMDVLIVGRVLAGAGGSGMYLGTLTYIAVFTSMRERSLYNALTGLCWGLGTILGPLIGGSFSASSATWRWSFYINLVIAAAMAPILILYLPSNQPQPNISILGKLKSFDWIGSMLIAAVYVTYTLALTFGGAQWAWSGYQFILTIVIFALLLIVFAVTQYFTVFTSKERRIFPGQFLRSRTLLLIFFTTAANITTMFIAAYYIPLLFQFARGDTAIMAAVRLLPYMVVCITFIMLNGALMPIFGYYMPWYVVSGIFQIIGGSLMYTIDSTTSPSKIYGYSVLVAIGAGLSVQSGYSIAAAKVKPEEIPAAIAFVNVAQIGNAVVALTISGTIFQNLSFKHLSAALSKYGYTPEQIRDALAGTQSALFQNGTAVEKAAALVAIVKAMDSVFILIIVSGCVTLVSSLFMKREKLFIKMVAGG